MSRQGKSRQAIPAAFLLLAGVALSAPLDNLAPGVAADSLAAAPPSPDGWTAPPRAIEAVRAGDCADAITAIESTTEEAAVVTGLYFHACGSHAGALRRLRAIPDYTGPLADWRLWAIGESATALGQPATAQEAFTALAIGHPDSPLASAALTVAAELALARDNLVAVADLVAAGRVGNLTVAERERLETVGWLTAAKNGNTERRVLAARRLLVDHPLAAARLEVVEVLRQPDGDVDWPALFSADELTRRARALIDADLADPAVEVLDRIALEDRDNDWTLLKAEALTEARRGAEALDLLVAETGATLAEESRIEWRRARAGLEASVARRGRATSAAHRRERRQTAHLHLRRVVALGADAELSRRALRILFADLADDGRFEEAVEILRALRRLEPADETGAGYLWRHGWRELERRNHSSAIGYWAELRDLYPDSTAARRALYWSARAHQALGNADRSQDLFRQVVTAPLSDFYHRHAMEWLVDPPPPVQIDPVPTPWPHDPALSRARRLSQIGLDGNARIELELNADHADPRAVQALLAEILARQGETRRSIIELRRAFPELGTHRQHRAPAAALRLYYPLAFDGLVTEAARRHELSPHLVFAMIRQESAFDSGAHSHAGARGLMQVMPATGRELAARLGLSYHRGRLVEPGFSVQLGTAYYRQILRSFGDEELALAGYNGGPNRIRRLWSRDGDWNEVDRFIESLPLSETRTYVQRIVLLSNAYRDLYSG